MKIIGLIGGMSWESSVEYYRIINEGIKARLGGWHSARILLFSVDFHEVEACQRRGDWLAASGILVDAARRLEKGGADMVLICTNTMHKIASDVQAAVSIPLIHIADAVADDILQKGFTRVGLLGTRFTMEQNFLKSILRDRYHLSVVIPEIESREYVHHVIYNELCVGIINPSSKRRFVEIVDALARDGAQGVILGCTEIPLLVQSLDVRVPLFDSTAIHAAKAVEYALGE